MPPPIETNTLRLMRWMQQTRLDDVHRPISERLQARQLVSALDELLARRATDGEQ